MMRQPVRWLLVSVVLLAGCQALQPTPARTAAGGPLAARAMGPAEDPERVALGFRLWFEPRLSGNNRMTCGTCHMHHKKGFSNGEPTAAGITGERGDRNVPTIYGAARTAPYFWDGRAKTLEEQALGPIENPIEMNAKLPEVVRKLEEVPYYRHQFKKAFGTGVTPDGIAKAIAAFERALEVGPTDYDRFLAGEGALTPSQERGRQVFFGKGNCKACHHGPDLTDNTFRNTGVGLDRPNPDLGRFAVTGDPAHRGAFNVPTLRNVSQTAPYMHDGSLPTLAAVVDFYDRGGVRNPQQDPAMRPLGLTPGEKADLVAFLEAQTGPDNLKAIAKLPGIRLPKEPPASVSIPMELR